MAFISLIAPVFKGILGAKVDALTSGDNRSGSKMLCILFWVIAVMGGFFALSGLYDYFNSIYTPVYAKEYMALACFAFSIGGSVMYCIIKWIVSLFQKPKGVPAVVNTVEHQVSEMMNVIQTEGLQLIKQHPLAAVLVGVTVGLLSGTSTTKK